MKRVLLSCILLLLAPFAAQGAFGYTLDELMALSVKNRDLVKNFAANLEKSREDVKFFKGNFYPTFDVGYAATRLGEDTTFEARDSNELLGVAAINVFSGFSDINDYEASKSLSEAAALRLSSIEEDVRLATALRLLAVRRNIARLKVSGDEVKLFRERYENIKSRRKVGLLKKNDLLKIKVEMDDAIQQQKTAEAEVSKSLNDLSFTVGVPVSRETLDYGIFETLPETFGYAHYEPQVLSRRSELAVLRKRRDAAGFQAQSARSPLYPKADFALSYRHLEEDYLPGAGAGDENDVRLQLKVSINLFDGYQKYTGIRQAELSVEQVNYELNELTEALKTALRNILLDIGVSRENLEVAQSSQVEAEENLRVTELSFGRGLATSADLLDAIFFLSRAKFNVIDAKTEIFGNNFRLTRMIEGFVADF